MNLNRLSTSLARAGMIPALIGALALPGAAQAEAMPPAGPPPLPLHGLQLNDSQQDRVFEIQYANAPAWYRQTKALRSAEQKLQALRLDPQAESAALRQAAEEFGKALAELTATQIEAERQILAALSAEQKQKLREQMQRMPPPTPFGHGPTLHRPAPPPPEKFAACAGKGMEEHREAPAR